MLKRIPSHMSSRQTDYRTTDRPRDTRLSELFAKHKAHKAPDCISLFAAADSAIHTFFNDFPSASHARFRARIKAARNNPVDRVAYHIRSVRRRRCHWHRLNREYFAFSPNSLADRGSQSEYQTRVLQHFFCVELACAQLVHFGNSLSRISVRACVTNV